MANKLDDIFSPERLRQSWKRSDNGQVEHTQPSAPEPAAVDAMAVFDRLQGLIRQRFNIAQGGAMQVLLSELQELLHKRSTPAEEGTPTEEERTALNASIEELLKTVEDLVEALELQAKTNRP